jgi:hypothetical protein
MMTLTTAVILGALYLAWRWGFLSLGSCVAGILVGLVFAGSSIGAPIGTAVKTSANSLGQSISAGIGEVIK